jgi:hypothetical protein
MFWVLAFCFYLVAVAPPINLRNRDWIDWLRAHPVLIIIVLGVLLLSLGLRLWQIESVPYTLAGDEASQGLEAVKVLNGDIRNPFTTGWFGVPTLSFFLNSLTINWLGQTITGLRLPWVLIGTVTVLVTFFLVKRLKGVHMALVVSLLVATYHYHIHFSRLGSNQVADPLFLTLALLFLYRALDEQSYLDWALAGGITGLAFYFYAGARITVVIILAVLAYEMIRKPRQFWGKYQRGLLILLGGFLLIGGPILQYAIRFPNDFNARINEVGIIQSDWLEQEVDVRQDSTAVVLLDQFQRAALAFNFYPDRTVWYGLRQPLLNPFFGTLFLLGLFYSTLKMVGKMADVRSAPMVIWWWLGILLGGMMTESPPSSQRLVSLAIPACYFVSLVLLELIQLARKAFYRVPVTGLLTIAILLFSVQSLHTYFIRFTPQRLYGGRNAELATEIAPLLNKLALSHHIYFAGAPRMYWDFATLPYLVPGVEATDIIDQLAAPVSLESEYEDIGAVFVFLPHRLAELKSVQHTFPVGDQIMVRSPSDGRLMVVLYVIPPPAGKLTEG